MMNKETIKMKIWGRELPIEIRYDCFEGEDITEIQKKALSGFLEYKDSILDNAYEMLKHYCLEEYIEDYSSIRENVFKCVKPKTLYIKKSFTKKQIVGLLCDFVPDPEHGLAIYVEDCKAVRVGPQDIIL